MKMRTDESPCKPDARELVIKYADPTVFEQTARMAHRYIPEIEHRPNGRKNGVSFNVMNGRAWHLYKTKTKYIIEHHGIVPHG